MTESDDRRFTLLSTPTGPFAVLEEPSGDVRTSWVRGPDDPWLDGARHDPDLRPDLIARLRRAFAGEDVAFDDVPTPDGGPFFRRCWDACRTIPRGETRTYAQLAEMAGGSPRAARAAGQAMRRNPLPMVVPCHRVRATDGGLGGFMGVDDDATGAGPLGIKRWLLTTEAGRSATRPLVETGSVR